MSNKFIIKLLNGIGIPGRLINIVAFYLLSIMIPASKHTLKFAEKISGKANSLFSYLLRKHLGLSTVTLNRLSRRRIAKLMRARRPLFDGATWTIAIIIDSTLHSRSGINIQNAQRFNHGQGWITGHQWTNIAVLINGQIIALPPIPFYTTDECQRRGIKYRTEDEKIAHLLKTLDLFSLLGEHLKSEIVVIADSGYDSKIIQNTVVSRKIDFVFSVIAIRGIYIDKGVGSQISCYFKDGRRSWNTI
ncbi:MAG: hypothetical protein HQK53_03070 [Oligoflexia bacterium]|nr:hypothetical protein [Oligoflexia bacterium]